MPKLFRVLIPVSDIEQAEQFYEAVLDLKGKRISPGRHYFNCDGVILACYDPQADEDGRTASPNPEDIYIAVDDLKDTYQRCQQADAEMVADEPPGIGPLGEIHQRPWGEISFYIKDPFGNPICFVDQTTLFTG